MLAPVEALEHVKCSACTKHLSYFPIYISHNSEAICGRCSENLPLSEYTRNSSYENLAQYLKFPCMYGSEGCLEKLPPANIPNHEKYCPYRIISCSLECVWQGTVNELLTHLEEIHPNALLNNGEFEIDILEAYETYSYLTHEEEIFCFKRKFDPECNVVECSVSCVKTQGSITKYFYEVTVFNGTKSLCRKFPMKSADNFQEEQVTPIDVANIKKTLDDPTMIIGNINILTMPEITKEDSEPDSEIKFELLNELECPYCLTYIIPPIFQCVTGHSICCECKELMNQCPTCQSEIKNTQNFSLEKMAYHLDYPCKFRDYGCNFISKPGKIKLHQKFCEFGPQNCPLKEFENCKWQNVVKEIYPHVVKSHYENILDVDTVTIFVDDGYLTSEDHNCYIRKFINKIFKLHCKYANNNFYWSMQFMGPPEEATSYKFEIDIVDNSDSNLRLFLRSCCTALKSKEDAFKEEGSYVFVSYNQIKGMITDHLKYIVRVSK